MKANTITTLHAVWSPFFSAYRLYDPKDPEETVAYVKTTEDLLESEALSGYTIVLVDLDTYFDSY